MPVANFPAEFLELYLQAGRKAVTIELESPRKAHRLRSRLHSLRVEMRKESHRYLTIAEGVQISIKGNLLTARPTDESFVKALHAAGIAIDAETPELPGLSQHDPANEANPADAALADMFRSEKKT